jgi:hypothetical protein
LVWGLDWIDNHFYGFYFIVECNPLLGRDWIGTGLAIRIVQQTATPEAQLIETGSHFNPKHCGHSATNN